MLKKEVLIQHITNLSDARYGAGMMVDYLSFPTDEKDLSLDQFKEISNWVSGVKIVGQTKEANLENIQEIINNYDLNYIIIGQPKLANKLTINCILELDYLRADLEDVLDEFKDKVSFFVINLEGELNSDIIDNLSKLTQKYSLFVNEDASVSDYQKLIDLENLKGVALSGSYEVRPGFKDYDALEERLELLEID